jgi:hypothetical protein
MQCLVYSVTAALPRLQASVVVAEGRDLIVLRAVSAGERSLLTGNLRFVIRAVVG